MAEPLAVTATVSDCQWHSGSLQACTSGTAGASGISVTRSRGPAAPQAANSGDWRRAQPARANPNRTLSPCESHWHWHY